MLEARDRVGGRTLNHRVQPGVIAELGGQYVGPTQDRLLALAESRRRRHVPDLQRGRQRASCSAAGARATRPTPVSRPTPTSRRRSSPPSPNSTRWPPRCPSTRPGRRPAAAEWDTITLEAWKQQNLTTPGSQQLFDIACEAVWGAEPRQMSLLYAWPTPPPPATRRRRATSSGWSRRRAARRSSRFVGGSQRIAQLVAKQLGAQVVLRSPVRRIEQGQRPRDRDADRDRRRGAPGDRRACRRCWPRRSTSRPRCRGPSASCSRASCRAASSSGRRSTTSPSGATTASAARPSPSSGRRTRRSTTPRPRAARASCSGSSAATEARALREAVAQAPPRGGAGQLRRPTIGAEARHPDASFELNWTQEAWTRGCPVGHTGAGVLHALRARSCASRTGTSTGPAPRRPTTGTATWTAPCAPARRRRDEVLKALRR